MERATELSNQSQVTFNYEKVEWKWHTLTIAYIKAKHNNSSTGNDTSKFELINEMPELIETRSDINLPVTAAARGVRIHRPDQIDLGERNNKQGCEWTRHDINLPVTAAARGVRIHRPDQVDLGERNNKQGC